MKNDLSSVRNGSSRVKNDIPSVTNDIPSVTNGSSRVTNDIDPLVEWAVWGNLDKETDLQLILLKGHLLLEYILDTALKRNNILDYKNYSFYRKILTLEKIDFRDNVKKNFIISSLQSINKLRNKVAHEFIFDIKNGEFELWSSNVLENLKGTKFTKYTFRTKIVHSFSIISMNILELTDL